MAIISKRDSNVHQPVETPEMGGQTHTAKNWEKSLTPAEQELLQTFREVDSVIDAQINKKVRELNPG